MDTNNLAQSDRRSYALNRMAVAIDRLTVTKDQAVLARTRKWIEAWCLTAMRLGGINDLIMTKHSVQHH